MPTSSSAAYNTHYHEPPRGPYTVTRPYSQLIQKNWLEREKERLKATTEAHKRRLTEWEARERLYKRHVEQKRLLIERYSTKTSENSAQKKSTKNKRKPKVKDYNSELTSNLRRSQSPKRPPHLPKSTMASYFFQRVIESPRHLPQALAELTRRLDGEPVRGRVTVQLPAAQQKSGQSLTAVVTQQKLAVANAQQQQRTTELIVESAAVDEHSISEKPAIEISKKQNEVKSRNANKGAKTSSKLHKSAGLVNLETLSPKPILVSPKKKSILKTKNEEPQIIVQKKKPELVKMKSSSKAENTKQTKPENSVKTTKPKRKVPKKSTLSTKEINKNREIPLYKNAEKQTEAKVTTLNKVESAKKPNPVEKSPSDTSSFHTAASIEAETEKKAAGDVGDIAASEDTDVDDTEIIDDVDIVTGQELDFDHEKNSKNETLELVNAREISPVKSGEKEILRVQKEEDGSLTLIETKKSGNITNLTTLEVTAEPEIVVIEKLEAKPASPEVRRTSAARRVPAAAGSTPTASELTVSTPRTDGSMQTVVNVADETSLKIRTTTPAQANKYFRDYLAKHTTGVFLPTKQSVQAQIRRLSSRLSVLKRGAAVEAARESSVKPAPAKKGAKTTGKSAKPGSKASSKSTLRKGKAGGSVVTPSETSTNKKRKVVSRKMSKVSTIIKRRRAKRKKAAEVLKNNARQDVWFDPVKGVVVVVWPSPIRRAKKKKIIEEVVATAEIGTASIESAGAIGKVGAKSMNENSSSQHGSFTVVKQHPMGRRQRIQNDTSSLKEILNSEAKVSGVAASSKARRTSAYQNEAFSGPNKVHFDLYDPIGNATPRLRPATSTSSTEIEKSLAPLRETLADVPEWVRDKLLTEEASNRKRGLGSLLDAERLYETVLADSSEFTVPKTRIERKRLEKTETGLLAPRASKAPPTQRNKPRRAHTAAAARVRKREESKKMSTTHNLKHNNADDVNQAYSMDMAQNPIKRAEAKAKLREEEAAKNENDATRKLIHGVKIYTGAIDKSLLIL